MMCHDLPEFLRKWLLKFDTANDWISPIVIQQHQRRVLPKGDLYRICEAKPSHQTNTTQNTKCVVFYFTSETIRMRKTCQSSSMLSANCHEGIVGVHVTVRMEHTLSR